MAKIPYKKKTIQIHVNFAERNLTQLLGKKKKKCKFLTIQIDSVAPESANTKIQNDIFDSSERLYETNNSMRYLVM